MLATRGTKKTVDRIDMVRPQTGGTMLRKEMDGFAFRGGYKSARDDDANIETIPDLVKEA